MRIILKPMGVATLGAAFAILTAVAIQAMPHREGTVAGILYAALSAPASAAPARAAEMASPVGTAGFGGKGIYDDALEGGWLDWSWGDRDLTESRITERHSAHSICSAANFGEAVYFAHTPASSAPYDRISFSVNGGETGGQELVLAAVKGRDNNKHNVVYEALRLPPLHAHEWTPMVVSLAQLRAANQPDLGGFWLQRDDKGNAGHFYIDNVRLLTPDDPAPCAETLVRRKDTYESRIP